MNKFSIKINLDKTDQINHNSFIEGHPQRNVFQTYEMYLNYKAIKNFDPFIYVIYNSRKEIVGSILGYIQKESNPLIRFVSARAVINGGPLIIPGDKEQTNEIAKELLSKMTSDLRSKCMYIQFRNMFSCSDLMESFKSAKYEFLEHLNYFVNTEDEALTRKRVSKSKLRQVKTGLKNNAVIEEPKSLEEVSSFFEILKDLYKNKVKKPLPDWSFFENFYHESKKGKLGKYFLIKDGETILGGIMCPISFDEKIHEWFVAAVNTDSKKQYPGILSTWAPIQYGIDNNFECFDFMGAGKPDEAYGVREFKEKFGGELVNYGRFERINRPLLYKVVKYVFLLTNK